MAFFLFRPLPWSAFAMLLVPGAHEPGVNRPHVRHHLCLRAFVVRHRRICTTGVRVGLVRPNVGGTGPGRVCCRRGEASCVPHSPTEPRPLQPVCSTGCVPYQLPNSIGPGVAIARLWGSVPRITPMLELHSTTPTHEPPPPLPHPPHTPLHIQRLPSPSHARAPRWKPWRRSWGPFTPASTQRL